MTTKTPDLSALRVGDRVDVRMTILALDDRCLNLMSTPGNPHYLRRGEALEVIKAHHPAPRHFKINDRVGLALNHVHLGTVRGVIDSRVWVLWDNGSDSIHIPGDLTDAD